MKNILKIALAIFATCHMAQASALSEFLVERIKKRAQIQAFVKREVDQASSALESKKRDDEQYYQDAILASYHIPLEKYECWFRFTHHEPYFIRTIASVSCNRDDARRVERRFGEKIIHADDEIDAMRTELEKQCWRDIDELHGNAQKREDDLIKAHGLEITEDERQRLIAELKSALF
jgi:hypothetical protein